ncbi:MAG: PKD domain-containing protein, partial [Thermotogae bacterium]|nr:PKD domain-containing protein [Thermotogota bacterium]
MLKNRLSVVLVVGTLIASLLAVSLVGCKTDTNTKVKFNIYVDGLPNGRKALVAIYGPNDFYFKDLMSVDSPLDLTVTPGIYKILFYGVTLDDGTLYMATPSSLLVKADPKISREVSLNITYSVSGFVKGKASDKVLRLKERQVLSVTPDYVDLTNINQTIEPGRILLSGPLPDYSTGFLRKVISVTQINPNVLRVYTERAAFSEAFPGFELKIEKESNEYETAAALAVYDGGSFNIDLIKMLYEVDNTRESSVKSQSNSSVFKKMPIVGMDGNVHNFSTELIQTSDINVPDKVFVLDKKICISTIVDTVDKLKSLGFFKNIKNLSQVLSEIKAAADRIGVDPCVYIKGRGKYNFSLVTMEISDDEEGLSLPVSADAAFYASWVDDPLYGGNGDGIRLGLKVQTKKYKSKYEGDLYLPPLPMGQYTISAPFAEISIGWSFYNKLSFGLEAKGQAENILENGLNLVDIFTWLRGWVTAHADVIDESGYPDALDIEVHTGLRLQKPKVYFLTDEDDNKIGSFDIYGHIAQDSKVAYYLYEPLYDSATLEPEGVFSLKAFLRFDVNADLACAKDPWWSLSAYANGHVLFNFKSLGLDIKDYKKAGTFGPWKLEADPVIKLNTKKLTLVPGESGKIRISVYGPMNCLGRKLTVKQLNDDVPIELLTHTINLNYLYIPTEKYIKIRAKNDASEGQYDFGIKLVGDRLGIIDDFSREYYINLTIKPGANHRPIINFFKATPQRGHAPLSVGFTARAEDPDKDTLNCLLNFGDGSDLYNTCLNDEKPVYHIYTEPGEYHATYSVSDGKSKVSKTTKIVVQAKGPNHKPEIKSFSVDSYKIKENETVRFSWRAQDPDGDPLVCDLIVKNLSANRTDALFKNSKENCNEGSQSYRPTLGAGNYKAIFKVREEGASEDESVSKEVSFKVEEKSSGTNYGENAKVRYFRAYPSPVSEKGEITLEWSAYDPEGNPLVCSIKVSYRNPEGKWVHKGELVKRFAGDEGEQCAQGSLPYKPQWGVGTYVFDFNVRDVGHEGKTDHRPATVQVINKNAEVISFDVSPKSIKEGESFNYSWRLRDEEGDPIVCRLDVGKVRGPVHEKVYYSRNCPTTYRGTYTPQDGPGEYWIALTIHDIKHTNPVHPKPEPAHIVVLPKDGSDHKPEIQRFTVDPNEINVNETVQFAWRVRDPDGDPLVCDLIVKNLSTNRTDVLFRNSRENCNEGSRPYRPTLGAGDYKAIFAVREEGASENESVSREVSFKVKESSKSNQQAVADSFSVTPSEVYEDGTFTVSWRAHD